MAYKYGLQNAVVEATKSFDRHIDSNVPRIALIDYANREDTDTLKVADALGNKLNAVRVDTCGENVMQGGTLGKLEYWDGNGVTILGVDSLNRVLRDVNREDVKVILTSGFGDVSKVEAFAYAEKYLGRKLFDGLGVGGIFESRMATMDVVAIGDERDHMIPMSKVGRVYRPNPNLELRLGCGK
ncbi:hypothetical protein COU57_05975 [Candidatus Pacearchaeota archaeon CG10_big_fil_rev_8_21_14_0_10_32_14]|nr:MAG: hypothetical protein COU57_05975 [Candidatus Pacearchaeota archaeon CG10_big_fil_rev_8_21_14_0_10_32_14]